VLLSLFFGKSLSLSMAQQALSSFFYVDSMSTQEAYKLPKIPSKKNPSSPRRPRFDFNIDDYLNPFVPRNRLHLLPKSISWFLGHRDSPRPAIGSLLVWFWAFVGAVAGILVVEAVFMTPAFRHEGTPIVIASFVRPPSSSFRPISQISLIKE
jgi:hypothetical protein